MITSVLRFCFCLRFPLLCLFLGLFWGYFGTFKQKGLLDSKKMCIFAAVTKNARQWEERKRLRQKSLLDLDLRASKMAVSLFIWLHTPRKRMQTIIIAMSI